MEKLCWTPEHIHRYKIADEIRHDRRMFNMAVPPGRSEERGQAYSVRYVEPLRDARTPLADFVTILLLRVENERTKGGDPWSYVLVLIP